ncbi:MAG: hypothetical protein RIT45_4007 [Pseudomonadota bacterium]
MSPPRPPARGGRGAARQRPPKAGAGKAGGTPTLAPSKPARSKRQAPAAPRGPKQRVTGTAVFPDVRYLGSIAQAHELDAGAPEIAFIGRSNVGKSSLLNALCGSSKLARVSKTPGRTQRIHVFEVSDGRGRTLRLCDLPGYGHAKTPVAIREGFGPMIEGYLTGRPRLAVVLLLWDARRDPDEETLGFLLWLREAGLRVRLVVTKLDKIARNRVHGRLSQLQRAMELDEIPLGTSTSSGDGVDSLRDWLLTRAGGTPT